MIVGIGTDIVKIERLVKRQEELALKILTAKEYEIYSQYNDKRSKEFLAGRFAAKEAIFKAFSKPSLVISDIEIINDVTGKPICTIDNYKISLSISHEDDYAIAFAIIEKGVE